MNSVIGSPMQLPVGSLSNALQRFGKDTMSANPRGAEFFWSLWELQQACVGSARRETPRPMLKETQFPWSRGYSAVSPCLWLYIQLSVTCHLSPSSQTESEEAKQSKAGCPTGLWPSKETQCKVLKIRETNFSNHCLVWFGFFILDSPTTNFAHLKWKNSRVLSSRNPKTLGSSQWTNLTWRSFFKVSQHVNIQRL